MPLVPVAALALLFGLQYRPVMAELTVIWWDWRFPCLCRASAKMIHLSRPARHECDCSGPIFPGGSTLLAAMVQPTGREPSNSLQIPLAIYCPDSITMGIYYFPIWTLITREAAIPMGHCWRPTLPLMAERSHRNWTAMPVSIPKLYLYL